MEENRKIKIPGMLYILISFIPWIIYWILCSMGNTLGVLIPLIISLILINPQVQRRDFNLMDITSLLYFSIANVATFIFNVSVFMEQNGFMGYFVLFLMALISIIVKQPYTLQVSKRDYPEAYWKNKSFLAINNLITAVWAGIFLSNAVIFLFFSFPFTVILSNVLVALGIIFSTIFPIKAPAYFTTKEFKRYDWNVKVEPKIPKGENEYDVIIVGSGIAGLVCGALLSRRGYKVLVMEQHSQVGGYCSSFQRGGFVFNTGVEDVSGLWERGPVTRLLEVLGLKREDLFVRNTTRYILKGEEISANNLEEFTNALSSIHPEEKDNISSFFSDAERAYIECYQGTEIYGVPLPAELIVKVWGERELLDYPRKCPHFYDWMNKTYIEKLDEYFNDEDLKYLMSALLGYVGTEPEKTPASSALTACVSYYLHGGYFPKGGAQRFANTLRDFVEEQGGEVLTRHKVDKIVVEKGKVTGVRRGENTFEAPIVVANTNAKTTFLELVGEDILDKEFTRYIKGLKMSPSAFMVFLGADVDLSSYPTLIKNFDEGYEIIIKSNADPT